jgi:hypothetical protein
MQAGDEFELVALPKYPRFAVVEVLLATTTIMLFSDVAPTA